MTNAQRLVLAAAAGRARHLRLPKPLLARGAYPQAAKPLSAANGVGWRYDLPEPLPSKELCWHSWSDFSLKAIAQRIERDIQIVLCL
jgi:hypothetical protein